MGNIDWRDGVINPNRRPVPDTYKPKALRLASVEGDDPANYPTDDHPKAPAVDLHKLEEELNRRRLDEIADVVRALTYGEMMELAASMWNVKPDGSSLTEHNLPAVLYRWSTTRQT